MFKVRAFHSKQKGTYCGWLGSRRPIRAVYCAWLPEFRLSSHIRATNQKLHNPQHDVNLSPTVGSSARTAPTYCRGQHIHLRTIHPQRCRLCIKTLLLFAPLADPISDTGSFHACLRSSIRFKIDYMQVPYPINVTTGVTMWTKTLRYAVIFLGNSCVWILRLELP